MLKPLTPFLLLLAACSASNGPENPTPTKMSDRATNGPADPAQELELATFGAGCFWCVEAVLEQVEGVKSVTSGYMGGHVDDPTYKQVCGGDTGHAEVTQVEFDPSVVSYEHLLAWFWKLHDPTTLNRQGNDVGTQYRSVIFFHSPEQERIARASLVAEEASLKHPGPIVTEVSPASTFYSAEDYHQDYYRGNKAQGYCRFVIAPKLEKLGLDH
ncbi:MAG: peptide-methionine (S)-S-oxide reductase MsrA [Planctomycetes bacterium]|nr:peptide-methionine (S)-S-oxide reductase MsrA [Planctomycetota bacterium]MCB9905559.1 peptide-methionine (S)-S-oxide reductase MsrA [Planctomycetota bacterium]